MEAPISSSLGAMGSLLGKLDELLRTAHRALSIKQLRNDLGVINTRLVELSKLNAPSLTAKYWMKDVRELSYDMDDCVDQFVHADADAKMDWIEKISGFKTRVEEANERHDRYKLDCALSSTNKEVDHRLPTVDAKAAIDPLGIDGPMSELDRLLTDGEQQLRVVSIVGVGGVGKSTLAQKIFCKQGEQFECLAFVQMAKKPDVRRILRSMLSQVRPHQPPEACEVHNLIHDLRKHLQDKRYFFIVDDLWATSAWDIVSRAFPEGNRGSRIVTTTKFEDVALACCGYKSKYIFKMKPLSDDDSKKIFISVVFGSGKGCPQQFSDVSDEITKKCGGLPLALISIANILASQPKSIEHWEYVQNFMSNNLRTNPTFDDILKQALDLCYNSLSHCLKTCLLYLGVYPENYTIRKEDLVKQWVAEGFICATEGENIMEVAGSYFDKLVNFRLIQCIYINNNDKVLSYVVHHMVLDLITSKSIEENFITIMDYSHMTVGLSDTVRRLSLHFGSATYATTPAGIELSHVRSLVFLGLFNCMPSIVEFMLLRVLILHFLDDNGNKSFDLRGICELFRLTYLQITCNVTVKLPDQMQWLKHLETLEINARAVAVPSDIVHLSSLLHLRLRGERNLPAMIGNRKSVTLDPGASGTAISLDDTTIVPSPPVFLQTFELLPPICIFARLPMWMGQLRKLCILKIVVRELLSNDIDILAGLPELTVLSLYVRQPTAEKIVFNRGTFPLLKCSKFWCGVLFLAFQEEAMPNLRRLKLGFNAHRGELYGNMLAGIEHLLNLQEIDGRIGAAAGAEESDLRAAESAFKEAVCKHSRLTSFDIRRVDWVDEELDETDITQSPVGRGVGNSSVEQPPFLGSSSAMEYATGEEENSMFETSHVLGALLASSPLLARAWDCCVAATAAADTVGFMHGGGGTVYVAFSGVQAALSVAGAAVARGADAFAPVGLGEDAAGRLFAPLVGAEPEVAVQALALQWFLKLYGSPEFQMLLNQIRGKAVVFTGHSLGGTIAALAALHYLCISSSSSTCAPAPPVLCVTFGSPLLGNEALSRAILRERWGGNFCHVVSQYDVVPRLLFCPLDAVPTHVIVGMQLHQWPAHARHAGAVTALMADTDQEALRQLIQTHAGAVVMEQKLAAADTQGGSPYRPFGTYVLCSPDGAACVDNPTAAVQMLYATFAARCAPGGAVSPEAAHSCYGDLALKMPQHLLRKRRLRSANDDAPAASNYDAGISLALGASGINGEATEAATARHWLKTSKRAGRRPSLNCASLATRLGRITPCRAQIEWYKASFDCDTGYYDAFKQRRSPKKFSKANMYRIKLGQFWDGVLAMFDTSQLPHDFHRRSKWVNAARFYQLLVEPLDIADYHRNNFHKTRGSYIAHGRERRYELFDKWWKEKGFSGTVTGAGDTSAAGRRMSRFAGLTQDPCFWARVEEAREQTEGAKAESDAAKLVMKLKSLRDFERYSGELVESKDVSVDVLAPQSSYTLWVEEWKELKLRDEVRTILFQF